MIFEGGGGAARCSSSMFLACEVRPRRFLVSRAQVAATVGYRRRRCPRLFAQVAKSGRIDAPGRRSLRCRGTEGATAITVQTSLLIGMDGHEVAVSKSSAVLDR
eukprot:scaffold2136_cov242-Pinguiococcus_pyrenoidosus.AAC.11